MRASLFRDAKSAPTPWEGTWEALILGLGPHQERHPLAKDRFQLEAYSPAEYPEGTKNRLAKLVSWVHFGVLDLDDVTDAQMFAVLDKIDREGLAACMYTTWSHPSAPPGRWRARVLVPFANPINGEDWGHFWAAFVGYFGVPVDLQCKDPSRLYYGAFVPEGSPAESKVFWTWKGKPLDLGHVIRTQAIPKTPGTKKVSKDRLQKLAQKWRRSSNDMRSFLGHVLAKVLDGEAYAEEGNRDETCFQLCQDLTKAFPDADVGHIAALFAQSHQLMGWEPSPSVEEKLRRAQEKATEDDHLAMLAELSERRIRIQQAFAHTQPGREEGYTEAELDKFATLARCVREEFSKRWIVQRGSMFYLYLCGSYRGPYSDKDVMSAMLRDLSPAHTAGVTFWCESKDGSIRRKTLPEMMHQYGSVAQTHVLDLTAQEARYDVAGRCLIEAPCPKRDLTPEYNQDIATWLELLAGPSHHRQLLDWISLVTSLDETCVALLLTGPPGTGKSLLAHGLGRIWSTEGPSELESALGSFNEALARNPLVLADETIPKDWRGYGRSAELRQFLATKSRPFRKKYAHESVILGAVRLIVTANNEDVLATGENLSQNDIEAIGERFYHVPTQSEASQFLTRWVKPRDWVVKDQLARHALWLKINHAPAREGRFLIRTADKKFHRRLVTKMGIRGDVCQALVSYLRSPREFDARKGYLVRVSDGQLLVNIQGMIDLWPKTITTSAVPPIGKLTQALGGVSTGRKALKANGKLVQYRVVDADILKAWAEETEMCYPEDIDHALSQDTESRIVVPRIAG